MILFITDNAQIEEDLDMVVMGSKEFNFIKAHPYIASSNFNKIYLDLTCPVNPKYVELLASHSVITPVSSGEITQDTIGILSRMYTDDAAALRYYYIKDKTQLGKLLLGLSDKYGWRSINEFI